MAVDIYRRSPDQSNRLQKERRHAPRRRYRPSGSQRRRLRPLQGVLRQAAQVSRLQAEARIRGHGRLEQRQDAVLDRRRRRGRQEAQISQRRHRLSSLCVRACEPQGRRRARRFSRRQRHDRRRSAGRVLRPQLLRRLFHRSRRHEARGHDLGAAEVAKNRKARSRRSRDQDQEKRANPERLEAAFRTPRATAAACGRPRRCGPGVLRHKAHCRPLR